MKIGNFDFKHGKYLGEGFYYKVYELDNTRVFKRLQPYWFSFIKIYNHLRKKNSPIIRALLSAHRARKREEKALKSMQSMLGTLPSQLFANPFFVNDLDYTQDKVTVISDIFEKTTLDNDKTIIDKYIELLKIFWSYGIHDAVYKLQPNYGLTQDGNIVCLDFGEFVFSKNEALSSMKNEKWLNRKTYKDWANIPLKAYYTQSLYKIMDKATLNRYWNIENQTVNEVGQHQILSQSKS